MQKNKKKESLDVLYTPVPSDAAENRRQRRDSPPVRSVDVHQINDFLEVEKKRVRSGATKNFER